MIQARVHHGGSGRPAQVVHHALNDVVVGRDSISRLVHLEVTVDDAYLITYRADAVIVATATGSTGYSISAGGPVLHPQSKDLLLCPVATHLGLSAALVLAPESKVEVALRSDYVGVLSLDGRMDMPVAPGDMVAVSRSPHVARFLRMRPPNQFYATLRQRLSPDARGSGTGSPQQP